jgi:fatty acid desaturase
MVAAVALGTTALTVLPLPAALAVNIVAQALIGRQQLALFLMLHDGAHESLAQSQILNDVMTTVLLGTPLSIDEKRYKEGHPDHHKKYGGSLDPGHAFHEALAVAEWPRDTWRSYIKGLLSRLPKAMRFYREEHTSSVWTVARFVLWHLCFIVLPLTALTTLGTAFMVWLAYWALPMIIVLPVLRLINETDSHIYDLGDTEFDTSVANTGWFARMLTHCYHDLWHPIHHVWPHVPYYRHRRLHTFLRERYTEYRNRLRERIKVLHIP